MDRRFPVIETTATILLGAIACGDIPNPDSPTPAPRLRDSAGVRIAENPHPPAGSRLGWEIGPEPAVNIGSADGEDPYLFHRVRDMATLSGGRIAVADAPAQEVRIFDPSGVHLATWGGEGEGPGEFRSLRGVARWRGDSVAAWEADSNRAACRSSIRQGSWVGSSASPWRAPARTSWCFGWPRSSPAMTSVAEGGPNCKLR